MANPLKLFLTKITSSLCQNPKPINTDQRTGGGEKKSHHQIAVQGPVFMPISSCFLSSLVLRLIACGVFLVASIQAQAATLPQDVPGVPDSVRTEFKLDDFYQKYMDVSGLPVVGSKNVSDAAIREAAWIVNKLLGHRPEILKAMAKNKTRFAIMAYNEFTTDIPEHAKLTPAVYWDRRARGLGATRRAPAVSCGEENLLCHPNDPYFQENIGIHEFAHAIHSMGMVTVDPTFDSRLESAFKFAIDKGLWKNTYASTNRQEYWAEAVQSWFDDNRENDSLHNQIDTRQELKDYDPRVARLCEEVFGDFEWRYQKPEKRSAADRAHLKDVDFENLPKFKWKNEPIPDSPKVQIDTTAGTIEVVLDFKSAPVVVKNFLTYVHDGHYSNGRFHRTLTADNQPDDAVKIGVVQAIADQQAKAKFPAPIKRDRNKGADKAGRLHLNGTLSMVFDTSSSSAQDHFVICIGDQPQLDLGGKRNPDGGDFVAFGKVTQGMELVEKIHQSTNEKQTLVPPIVIQRMVRLN
jgi:cyclophilin family peptidyl-prolyl cis-trans isomerase